MNPIKKVHLNKGLFFSFHADVGASSQRVNISADELVSFTGEETFVWGVDFNDDTFDMSMEKYINDYLLRKRGGDILNYSVIRYNESEPTGRIMNTIPEHYPESLYVEYYAPASPKGAHNWQALRFVYEEYNGMWFTNWYYKR